MKKKYKVLTSCLIFAIQTVNAQCPIPGPVTAAPNIFCAGATTSLNATAAGASINWYTVPTGGVPIGSSASGANYPISPGVTTTYYAESFFNPASTYTFNYTGAIQNFTVPAGVSTITLNAYGAEGGTYTTTLASAGITGKGARMQGTFTVTPGQVLRVLVGQKGGTGQYIGGGGGGSFIWDNLSNTLLIAAGGGGGAGQSSTGGANYVNGIDATTGLNGTNGNLVASGGGAGGNGGTVPSGYLYWAAGGAGWLSNGNNGSLHGCGTNAIGGSTPLTGGAGGMGGGTAGIGGFGGGGGGNARCGAVGGGGGGGYSGGGAGAENPSFPGGGGGGSYNNGTNQTNTSGVQTNNGLVIITVDFPGCVSVSRTPVTVTVNPSPTITVNNGTICTGDSFTMVPSGANTYTFEGGSAVVSPTTNSTYTIIGTSGAGCVSQGFVTCNVSVSSSLALTVSGGTSLVCSGSPLVLTAAGATSYTWSTGATTSTVMVVPVTNTFFTVYGTSSVSGCSGFSIKTVSVYPLNPIVALGSGSICEGQVLNLGANGAITYTWEPGSLNGFFVSVSPTISTNYTVTGTDANGCLNSSTVSVSVIICSGLESNNADEGQITLYPNPNNGNFTLKLNNTTLKKIEISDISGRIVETNISSKDQIDININSLSNGIYYVKIQSENSLKIIKVIKQ